MIKKFYEETGMYVDWKQLTKLPKIDTLIDIGVGPNGTEDLYNHFMDAKLILIDPIDEAKEYAKEISKTRDVRFFQNALGRKDGVIKPDYEMGYISTVNEARKKLERVFKLNQET